MPATDVEFERHVQAKAEQHLNACLEALDASDAGEEAESPAFALFDGCNTCIIREVLMVCWDEMWERAQYEAREENSGGKTRTCISSQAERIRNASEGSTT